MKAVTQAIKITIQEVYHICTNQCKCVIIISMKSLLERYCELGWFIFPLNPHTKRPLTQNGFKDASSDPERIRYWAQIYPSANWGVACGLSRLAVLDFDLYKVRECRSEFERLVGGPLPATVEAESGGGGSHLYYSVPDGAEVPKSRNGIISGVDFKASGGYIVIPPSMHQSGRAYKWLRSPLDGPPLRLPAIVASRLTELSAEKKETRFQVEGSSNLWLGPGSGRWDACQEFAGSLHNRGLSEKAIFQMLQVLRNEHMEYSEDVSDQKLRDIAAWIVTTRRKTKQARVAIRTKMGELRYIPENKVGVALALGASLCRDENKLVTIRTLRGATKQIPEKELEFALMLGATISEETK